MSTLLLVVVTKQVDDDLISFYTFDHLYVCEVTKQVDDAISQADFHNSTVSTPSDEKYSTVQNTTQYD